MLINKGIKSNEIKNIGYFEPISLISLIEKGNQAKLNDSLSLISTKVLDTIIENSNNPKISKQFQIDDSKLKLRLENDILKTMSAIKKTKKLEFIKTTNLMDSIVKNENQRFALCVINSGFDRRKHNYGNQIAKGIGIGILTLGMYTPVPIKSNTSTYVMIYDAQNSSIVFFNYFPIIEKSPTDKKNLNFIYNKLFEKYYNTK